MFLLHHGSEEWLRQNKLSFHTNKTEYMIIGHKQRINHTQENKNVLINGENNPRAYEIKYLGVTVDENLNFNRQCERLTGKLTSGLSSVEIGQ